MTSQTSHQFGAAFAILLFPLAGSVGTVTLRLILSALILFLVLRPSLKGHSSAAWVSAIALGLTLAFMNTTLYLAFDRIHLGTAVTIEMLGPLLLTVILARRASAWFFAALAFIGIVLIGFSDGFASGFTIDRAGLMFAFAAAFFWSLNILSASRTAKFFKGADGLAIAMVVAAVIIAPLGFALNGTKLLSPKILGIGLLVAFFSSALPYALDQFALRRIKAAQFSMLMSLAPAFAAIVGIIVLHQKTTPIELTGIAIVIIATVLAMRQKT